MVPVLRFWTWTDGAAPPPPVPTSVAGGGGGFPNKELFHGKRNPYEDERKLDRAQLRSMLEVAFADIPRDPAVREVRAEHRLGDPEPGVRPQVDWSSLLADLKACEKALAAYGRRMAAGTTRTQQGKKAREDLRFSEEAVDAMLDSLRAARAARLARRRRAAALLLLH